VSNDARAPRARPTIRVVAAALYDGRGQVLIAERPPGKHLSGRWEFPGGKIDAGETEAQALRRELHEELGVDVGKAHPLASLAHDYDDRRIEIALWVVEDFSGEPKGLDGQLLKWVSPAKLHDEDMLEADVPFIRALQRLYNERLSSSPTTDCHGIPD
jgi:8-oxo-dGTP diphosphatase